MENAVGIYLDPSMAFNRGTRFLHQSIFLCEKIRLIHHRKNHAITGGMGVLLGNFIHRIILALI